LIADQSVVADPAVELIHAGSAGERVVSVGAVQSVVAGAAAQSVVAAPAIELVVAVAALQHVVQACSLLGGRMGVREADANRQLRATGSTVDREPRSVFARPSGSRRHVGALWGLRMARMGEASRVTVRRLKWDRAAPRENASLFVEAVK
jgi:hypothetical protein